MAVVGQAVWGDPSTAATAPGPIATQRGTAPEGSTNLGEYVPGITVYQDPSGLRWYVDDKTGQLATNDALIAAGVHTDANGRAEVRQGTPGSTLDASVDPGEAVKRSARDLKDVADSANPVGTPLIDDGYQDKINDTVLGPNTDGRINGTTSAIPDIIGPDGINIPGLGGGGSFSLGAGITDPIQAAIAQQNAIAAQMGQERANFQGTASPTIANPAAIQAALAAQQGPIATQQAIAQQAQAANVGQTFLTPQQQAIQAQQVEAARIGQLQQGQTTQAGAATIDPALQAQIRQSQMGLVGGLENAIAGKEPSAAEIMLRNATDRNVANQYALAQAANGMNTGQAQRMAMINSAEMNQNAIMQQAILRAQEIAQARGQLGGVLDQTRGQDIGLATQQAGLQQQTNLANTGALNQASMFNAGQANDATTTQAQLQQQAALANQGAGLQAGTTNATLAQQNALANAAAQNTTSQQNAQMQQAAALQNAQLGTQASMANANNVTGANTASAQLANAVELANANNQTQANTNTAQLQTQVGIANAGNEVNTNQLNQKAQQDLAANQLQAAGQAGTTSIGYGDVAAKMAEAEAKRQAAMIAGISAAGAALISDRRQKTDIKPAEAEIAEFTAKLDPYAFRYKAPGKPGTAPGKRFGIMAQDLEKSAIGRSLVRRLPDGTKTIDVPQSIGAILATLSSMAKRQEAR